MYARHERQALAAELAVAFLDGPWRAEALAERGAGCLDRWPPWMDGLAFAAVAMDRVAPLHGRAELVALIEVYLESHDGDPREPDPPQIIRERVGWLERGGRVEVPRPVVTPDWPVAAIDSPVALAEWLELSSGQLAWLADVRGLERSVTAEQLRNYRYRWVARRRGLPRLIEAPKGRLKEIQRLLLRAILDRVPPHPSAHGFTPGRSVHTHAARHLGQPAVLRLDLRDFFASVPARRVFGIYRTLGYHREVAHLLTGLSTNTVPAIVRQTLAPAQDPEWVGPRFALERALATPHLPQGAPSSPALANLAAFGLDRRLAGLSAAWGLTYSRYADDLTFSGRALAGRGRGRFSELAETIVRAEGFRVHADKSLLRTAAQRQIVTGIVVNAHPNVPRDAYDRLRATLHRLALSPPPQDAGGEQRARLQGQVAWVASLNPGRGAKLRRMFDAVRWSDPADGS